MDVFDLIVVGGGASGFMSAITAAENQVKKIIILESSTKLLEKVRISGGGRCNVTNASWVPSEFIENYPRGKKKLIESFSRFATGDVFEWFQDKGVKLKIEDDLRVFPVSDSSLDIVNCLKKRAQSMGIKIYIKKFVKRIERVDNNGLFKVFISKDDFLFTKKLLISTGGHPSGYRLAESLGHQIIKPIPSLFTFSCKDNKLKECRGVSVKNVDLEIYLNNKYFKSQGDLLITHWGFSGPSILRLSSEAARDLYERKYNFKLSIKWTNLDHYELNNRMNTLREFNGTSNLCNLRPIPSLTKRLWVYLLNKLEIDNTKTWSSLFSKERYKIINTLLNDEYQITGKGPFSEEFVTSGGVSLDEVSFKTMESFICKGLYFSGEVLDVDGITGGFNFQHCWTSGWLAGKAISN